MDLSGPLKRVVPKGFLLAKPGRQAPTENPRSIECGKCHALIYSVDREFDEKAFQEARRKHYLVSPACGENASHLQAEPKT